MKSNNYRPKKPNKTFAPKKSFDPQQRPAQKSLPQGLILENAFLNNQEYDQWINWLSSLHPIWESRYLEAQQAENQVEQRKLLRPVYWMGNWQFACLGYFQLPNGTQNRCVTAEPFPWFVQQKVDHMENLIRNKFPPTFIPKHWKLNTLLINYYGSLIEDDKKIDQARLGEHKDHEPGPVASVSFGAKTMFQFVSSAHRQASSQVAFQQWLEDNSFLAFAGDRFKNKLFHRVQRVDRKSPREFKCQIPNYEVRRINLTFRYVPEDCFVDYPHLPENLKIEIDPYINELAQHSDFFANIKKK